MAVFCRSGAIPARCAGKRRESGPRATFRSIRQGHWFGRPQNIKFV